MNTTIRATVLCLSLLACAASVVSAATAKNSYTEDFSTTAYKDAAYTTADWDTSAGELRLYPFVPTLVGNCTFNEAFDVVVDGDHAFVAAAGAGLVVVDISDVTSPSLAAIYDTPGYTQEAFVFGNYAYVADGESGLLVFDTSNPAVPALAATYNTPSYARGVSVEGDHAYVADGAQLLVLDISDPISPSLTGACNTPGQATAVFASGNHAYIADQSPGLTIVDIADPSAPIVVATLVTTPGFSLDVAVSGNQAYLANASGGLVVVDVSDPSTPVLIGSYSTGGTAYDVYVDGNYAYVADNPNGLQVVDITNPALPSLTHSYPIPGAAYGVFVSGNHAFVTKYEGGLDVVEVSTPVAPLLAGRYDTVGYATHVDVSGDYAYVVDWNVGVAVLDISNPEAPVLADRDNRLDEAQGVDVSGDYAYFVDFNDGLMVYDVRDPTMIALAGSLDTGYAVDVAISGDLAIIVGGDTTLVLVDISDPTLPTRVGVYQHNGHTANQVAVSGDYAFASAVTAGLLVFDISEPTAPALAGIYDTPGSAVGVTVRGDYAYVSDGYSGLQIIDITDPTAPALAGSFDLTYYTTTLFIFGDLAYLTDSLNGLKVIDISNPASPSLVSSFPTLDYARAVVVVGDHAFLASESAGLYSLRVQQREFERRLDTGRSLPINGPSNEHIVRARLVSTQTTDVTWELSTNDATSWSSTIPGSSVWRALLPGSSLLYRTKHIWQIPGPNPSVSSLQIDWRTDSGTIAAVEDVPGDQGGWARIRLLRSGYDFTEETNNPTLQYFVLRRFDEAAATTAFSSASPVSAQALPEELGSFPDEVPVYRWGARYFTVDDAGGDRASAAVAWEIVGSAPAIRQDEQIVVVPTLADSASGAPPTVYRLLAQSTVPGEFFYSDADSGFSLDNIAPGAPQGFVVGYNAPGGNSLSWDPSPDEDFQFFRVYRDTDPAFTPGLDNLVHSTADNVWTDPDTDGWMYSYKITALDHAGNESPPAESATTTGIDETPVVTRTALHQNIPNPFNPTTSIRYDVSASSAPVTLRIYTVGGRLVKTLVDRVQSAGEKTVVWNGRDDSGNTVATGTYFYRLTAPGFEQTRKMVLLK